MLPSSCVKATPAVSSWSLNSPLASVSSRASVAARPAVDRVGSVMPNRMDAGPLGVSDRRPEIGLAEQAEHVGPADVALRPAERLRHRPADREHQRRAGDARGVPAEEVLGIGPHARHQQPQPRVGHPHVGPRPVPLHVPRGAEPRGHLAGALEDDHRVDAGPADRGVGRAPGPGEAAQDREVAGSGGDGDRGRLALAGGGLRVVAQEYGGDGDQHDQGHAGTGDRSDPSPTFPLAVRHDRRAGAPVRHADLLVVAPDVPAEPP